MLCFPLPEQLPEAMRILLTERNQGGQKFQLRDDDSDEDDSGSDEDSDSDEDDSEERKLRDDSDESDSDSDESDEDSDESDEDSDEDSDESGESSFPNILIPPSCEEFLEKPCNASVVCIEIPQELYNELVALGMKGPERLDTGRMGTGQQDTGRQGTEEQGTYVDFYDETDFETYTDHTETETETPTPTVYYCDYYYDYYNWYEGGPDSWPWKLVEHSEEDVKERFWWNHHHRPQTTSVNTLCNNWQTFLGTIDTTSNTTVTSTFQTFFTSFCNTITRSGVAALGHEVPEDEGRIEARHPPPHPHPHPPSPPPSHSSPPPPPPPPPSTSASVKESRILKALRNVMA
ncbi:formin-binding protein 4-like [Penaeus chinensis]|uniref:formin-binding protein 4-like n=1 Tax=Penaeus chinensis TaxID=139456 RepID=UPI001FB71B0B|nr:formin-binding protein 4-like [Penaeus chinensis]